jgi:hypothetical protein
MAANLFKKNGSTWFINRSEFIKYLLQSKKTLFFPFGVNCVVSGWLIY